MCGRSSNHPVATPYGTAHEAYLRGYDGEPRSSFGSYVEFADVAGMLYGRDGDDNELSAEELEEVLPDEPLEPFDTVIDVIDGILEDIGLST